MVDGPFEGDEPYQTIKLVPAQITRYDVIFKEYSSPWNEYLKEQYRKQHTVKR